MASDYLLWFALVGIGQDLETLKVVNVIVVSSTLNAAKELRHRTWNWIVQL
jgi:hypothetical protein